MNQRIKLKGNVKFNPEQINTIELCRIEFNSGYEYYMKFILNTKQRQEIIFLLLLCT